MYRISSVLMAKSPTRYTLIGLMNEKIPGEYYSFQLIPSAQDPSDETVWLIRPDSKRPEKKIKGVMHVFVQWLFYPKKYGQWIEKSSFVSARLANQTIKRK